MGIMFIVFFIISVVCFISTVVIRVYRARHYRDLYNPVSMHKVTSDEIRMDARLWDFQNKAVYIGVFFLVSALIALLRWIA